MKAARNHHGALVAVAPVAVPPEVIGAVMLETYLSQEDAGCKKILAQGLSSRS
jgi:hypothetical protein